MADQEAITLNNFLQTQVIGSNDLPPKKKRNLPGNPDPEAEVLALSPNTLMATNRFLCEICSKGFQRDQNLQLHRRGHNLPWKLKQRTGNEPIRKKVYVCPEKGCVHNHPSRALGDLTGIKKHFSRKHGEKKWKCDKCNKNYAVQSDWKAHSKTCGTREYRCDCGTLFSRRDSFITHRAFCDALAEETARMTSTNPHFNLNSHFMMSSFTPPPSTEHFSSIFMPISSSSSSTTTKEETLNHNYPQINQRNSVLPPLWYEPMLTPSTNFSLLNPHNTPLMVSGSNPANGTFSIPALFSTQQVQTSANVMSATALLQKAAQIGATSTTTTKIDPFFLGNFGLINKGNINNDVNIENSSVNSTKFSVSIFGTSNSTTTNGGSDECGSSVDEQSTMAMYNPASKRRKLLGNHLDCVGSGGETRDFLGVSTNPTISCHPSSINGWI